MNRYFLAFLVCLGIFILWVIVQVNVKTGMVVNVLFMTAIVGAWRTIVRNSGNNNEKELFNKDN